MLKISAPATFSYLESSFHTAQASARGLDFDADQKIAASWDENERKRYAHPYCARIPVVMTSRHILSPRSLKMLCSQVERSCPLPSLCTDSTFLKGR